MGDFHPEAHVNGFAGCSFIALIFNSLAAICISKLSIVIGFGVGYKDK